MNKKYAFRDANGNAYPEWEQKKLGDFASIVTGNTPETNKSEFWGGEYLWVTPSDIGDNKIIKHSGRRVTEKGLKRGRYLPKGSLLITCIASIGKNAILAEEGSCNQQINAIIPSESFSTDYLYYFLGTQRNRMELLAGKTATSILNKTEFSKTLIPLPSLPEQQKIAEFFSALDERIDLTADKVKLLKEQKQGYLQQVFSRELVFTDDNGDTYGAWEQKKLVEIAAVTSGKRLPKGHQFAPSGTPYITVSDMGDKTVDQANFSYITPDTERILQRYKVIKGDIIISIAGTLGKVNLICEKLQNANLTENCDKIRVNEGIIPEFIYYVLKSPSIQGEIERDSTTSSQPKLALERLRNFSISLPSLPEQEKIAEFFSALDERIELAENKLALLKGQKKGYLQGIFG